jgi:hypothetical protein
LKKSQGTETERRVFAHLTKESFVDRLVRKRPLVFMGSDDSHLLRSSLFKSMEDMKVNHHESMPPHESSCGRTLKGALRKNKISSFG